MRLLNSFLFKVVAVRASLAILVDLLYEQQVQVSYIMLVVSYTYKYIVVAAVACSILLFYFMLLPTMCGPSPVMPESVSRFRLRGLDDSVRAAAGRIGPQRAAVGRRVLRGSARMRGIEYNSGKSLGIGPLG